jgi:DNA-binding MarR family transcriptional regulator
MGTNASGRRDTRAILDAVRRIVHALRESSRRAEQAVGLSGAQLFVLQTLAASPGLSMNELAAHTHTHQSSVSMVVARLASRRLVRRSRSEADGRSVRLSLTPHGRQAAGRAPDVAQARLVRGVETLSPRRRRLLAGALTDVAQATDAAAEAPVMFFEDGRRGRRGRGHV